MKVVRLAIFLAGVLGLAVGGVTTLSSLKSSQEEAQVRTNEALKAQAVVFVDQFFHVIEAVKTLPKDASAHNLSYVTHRAIIKMKDGKPSEVETFNSSDEKNTAALDFNFQERVMTALKDQIIFTDLQILKLSTGTFNVSDVGNRQGVFIAEPIFKTENGLTDTNALEKISVTLIDPAKAFAGVEKLSSTEEVAYVLSKKGKVLAHTQTAFVGTDLRKIEKLKDSIDHLFLGAQTGAVSKYTNVEGNRESVAFVRAGIYPFAVAVETKMKAAVLTSEWVTEQLQSGAAQRNWGLFFVLMAFALVSISVVSAWANRSVARALQAGRPAQAVARDNDAGTSDEISFAHLGRQAQTTTAAANTTDRILSAVPAFVPQQPVVNESNASMTAPESVENAASAFVESRSELSTAQTEAKAHGGAIRASRDYVNEFLNRIQNGFVVETIEKELVQLSSELTESSILLFRYHRRNQNLNLVATAGDVKIPNYSNMQAYVRKDIETQVEGLANEGKVASITHYGPLSKLIMGYLNIAHFEAWAITSSPEVSGQSKLVGVLIILQAGSQSAKVRPTLAKMIKEAGNYIYAQSSRIRPRAEPSHFESPNA